MNQWHVSKRICRWKRSCDCTCILVSLLAPLLLSAFRESSRLFLCNSLSANLNRTNGSVRREHEKLLNDNQISPSVKKIQRLNSFLQLLYLLNVGDMSGLNETRRNLISLHKSYSDWTFVNEVEKYTCEEIWACMLSFWAWRFLFSFMSSC